MLADKFLDLATQLRSINLSYNILKFKKTADQTDYLTEHAGSVEFLDKIIMLLKTALVLNHVDFSGMNIDKEHLIFLCKNMADIRLLMGIHINDNGVIHDEDLMM